MEQPFWRGSPQFNTIKHKFYQLVGALSVEEIMNNRPLIDSIQTLSGLLLAIENQKGRT
jgi:hypothetical protein